MSWRFCLILFIGVLLEWKLTLSAPAPASIPAETGKTKGKGRAYEFGFSIEEQQHRHEKRDENGIVMGEFGFITADGIYHVTVYATDENGKFKIISMKNYPYGNPEKKVMIATIPLGKKPVVTPTVIKAMMPDGKSCGGCVLPKKMNLLPADVMGKKPDEPKAVFRPLSKDLNDGSSTGKTNGGASAAGKSTSKSTGSPSSGAGAYGKGSSSSQKPLPKPPSTNPLVQPKFSKPEAGATSSKIQPKSTPNNGNNNNYQLSNFLTQSTRTPTQIPGTNTPKLNTQFGQSSRGTEFGTRSGSLLPTKQSNFNNQPITYNNQQVFNPSRQLTNPPTYYNTNTTPKKSQNTLSNTKPSLSQFLTSQEGLKTAGLQKPAISNSGSRLPSQISQTPFGNTQTVYSANSFTTKSPTFNTNTNPTQFSKNSNKISQIPNYPPKINNRFGFSNEENQFNPSRGSLPNTKFPNPNPFVIPTATGTFNSYVTALTLNPTKSFAIPAYNNGKIPSQQQQGPTINTLTQNAIQQQKPFQTLSKTLSDPSDGFKQNGVSTSSGQIKPPQTTTVPRNTMSQKTTSGQSPSQVTSAKPQSFGTNTFTQSPPSTNTLTPTRLQQNTNNGAKASTAKTQSTNEQSPTAPSTQANGKATKSSNNGSVSGASSKGNAVGGSGSSGDGGGPLYRFKYVLDYNSHREEGRIDGSKEGNYNTIDDDGIRRIIDYIANENGYQPHIKIERLPPNELPTGENKLKEYEFMWFN